MRRFTVIAACVAMAVPRPVVAQDPPRPGELAWVGLFNDELVGWLYNEYRLDELCGDRVDGCRDSLLARRELSVDVYDAPGGLRLGELVVGATPGQPLELSEVIEGRREPFLPDLFLEDWGYGPPWFHLTVSDRRDGYFRVPLPRMGTGWIRADDLAGTGTHVEVVGAGETVYATPVGDMVVLDLEDGVLVARPEQDADMWCRPEDVPDLQPWEEVRIPFAELFDDRGRLLLRPKYMKGC